MRCNKCGDKIKAGDKAYKQRYHKTCYEVIRQSEFEAFLTTKGYVAGARVEGQGLRSQGSKYGTIIAVRPWAQGHEAILVQWDDGSEGKYPWNYLKVALNAPQSDAWLDEWEEEEDWLTEAKATQKALRNDWGLA